MAFVPVIAEAFGKVWTNTMAHTVKLGTRVAFGVEQPLNEFASDVIGDCIGEAVSNITGIDALGWTASSIWSAGNVFFSPENADLSTQEKLAKAAITGAENFVEDIMKDELASSIKGDLIKNYNEKQLYEKQQYYKSQYDDVIDANSYNVNYSNEYSTSENYVYNKENIDSSFVNTNKELSRKYVEIDKEIKADREAELSDNYNRYESRRAEIMQNSNDKRSEISNKYNDMRQDLRNDTQKKLDEELQSSKVQEQFAQNQKEHENNVANIKEKYPNNEEGFKQAMDEENASYNAKNKEVINNTDTVKNYNNKCKELDEEEKAEKKELSENTCKELEENDNQLKTDNQATNKKYDALKDENDNAYKNANAENENNYKDNNEDNSKGNSVDNNEDNSKDNNEDNSKDNNQSNSQSGGEGQSM